MSEEDRKYFWIYVDWKKKLKKIDLSYDLFFENIKTTENMSL